ncbi:MAG: DNA repair protein RecN [Myxococcota bacterium]
MIRTLRVKNLATIEELELELGSGLNVLTGETGAGKSVLLNAIALLRGRRVPSEAIRTGASFASAEAIIDSPELVGRARGLGLAEDEDAELLVSRRISRDGRGKVFVNGRLATVSLLQQLLGDSLEVIGQGEHQRLLRPQDQAELLDRYGGLGESVGKVAERHHRWRELAEEIAGRRAHTAERARREDQLRFEIEQIDAANPRVGELEELLQERARLAHVERLGQATASVLEALEGDRGLRDRIAAARSELASAAAVDEELATPLAALERAGLELDEADAELARYTASLEADPTRLAQLEDRLDELGRLRARYGDSVEEILRHREAALAEAEALGGGEVRTAELESELESVGQSLEAAARRLGKARARVGAEFEARVSEELAVLGLGRAALRVRFEPLAGKTPEGRSAPSGPRGLERASFELAANPGEDPRRLRDAASGGELARLMLGLRNVLREAEGGHLLLFDEVDAGIGGTTARHVGERLQSLAESHQIVCITHLPQVAARGETHYRVAKRVRAGRTRTRVERLQAEDRVDELARMAGGGRVTDVARAHARELLASD